MDFVSDKNYHNQRVILVFQDVVNGKWRMELSNPRFRLVRHKLPKMTAKEWIKIWCDVSSTGINPYDPKGSDRIQTRLRPVIHDEANWFTDCWVVEEGVQYSFQSLNQSCLLFNQKIHWRCKYFVMTS